MLAPKRVKFRKTQKGRRRGAAQAGNTLNFGDYGVKATTAGWITSRQIEAARVAMTRFVKRGGKIWIRIFPDKPVTKKPAETRMGKGKGAPEEWVCVVRPGLVLRNRGGGRGDREGGLPARLAQAPPEDEVPYEGGIGRS